MSQEKSSMRSSHAPRGSLNIVQVSFHYDIYRRAPRELIQAWPTLLDVAAAVAGAGATVHVVQACHEDAVLREKGVDLHFVREPVPFGLDSRRWFQRLFCPLRLSERVASLAPDVVHVAGLNFPLQTRYLSHRLPGVPMICQDHANAPATGWRKPLYRWGLRSAGAVTFTAREQAAPFFSSGLLRPGLPVFEILEGSTHFRLGDQREARRQTGLYGDPVLLWLGRLDSNKDPLTVLEAVAIAAEELADPRLWCCYTAAPLEMEVRRRIERDPRLRGRVHLLGRKPHCEVESLCQAANFLVQGSHEEGSGYGVIEALACGATPIVTDIPSLRKITGNGRAGALSPPGDASAMARNLVEWSSRDRARLRVAARRHFEHALSYSVMGRDLRLACEQLLIPR